MSFYDIINWKRVSVFGKNKLINRSFVYLFIVPMLAKLLSKIESPLSLIIGGAELEVVLDLPFSWKLFFFSALLFTVASLLYHFISPPIINENISFGDFLNHKKNRTHIRQYMNHLEINREWLITVGVDVDILEEYNGLQGCLKSFDFYKTKWRRNHALRKIEIYHHLNRWLFDDTSSSEDSLELSFWLLYRESNRSRMLGLIVTAFMYLGGFVLISVVLVQSVIEVIKWV